MLSFLSITTAGHGYLALLASIWAATLGVPIPEEVPLLAIGVAASMGVVDLKLAILVGMAACFSGDLAVFLVGRRVGSHLSDHPYLRRLVNGRHLLRAKHLYVRRGPWTLSIARLLPGLKMPFLFTAGALRMSWRRFLLFDLLSVSVLVPALVLLGYHSSYSVAKMARIIHEAGLVGVSVFILIAAAATIIYLMRRRQRQIALVSIMNGPTSSRRSRKRVRRFHSRG